MKQLRRQNAQERNPIRPLGAENALLGEQNTLLELEDNIIKDVRNLFRLKKENEGIKDRILRDIRNLFEQEKEDYYKPVRAGNFWSRNDIEYESNRDRNKTLSIEEYLKKLDHIQNIS